MAKKKNNFKPVKKLKKYVKNEIERKGKKNFIWSVILIFLILMASICLIFALYIIISAPNFDKDKLYSKEATIIYDIKGNEFARIGAENRELVTYDDLPQVFIDALIATEDSRFFQHNGLDIARFLKASAGQVAGTASGGASTITMQLVKNIYTDNTSHGIKGIIRKFTDIYMAVFKIENCYTKEEIMEFYVNSLWLGYDGNLNYSGLYGVETASQYYFGKSVSELTLAEASLLVGMYQNASWYNPYLYPERCKTRQKTVLKLMKNHGYITEEQMQTALDIPIESLLVENGYLNSTNDNQATIDFIIDEVISKTKKDPRKESMQIYSTINSDVQDVLNELEKGNLFKFYTETDQEGVAITSTVDGSVTALSGGRNYSARGLNRAIDLDRQPGSTAKPLLDYAPYIEYLNGSTGEYFFDDPYTYSDGTKITNSDNGYQGMITMRTAIKGSRNIPALQAFQKVSAVDKNYIYDLVDGVGITYNEDLYESSSIGGFNGMSPLEMSAAYAMFGRGGYYIAPYVFTKIIYSDGTTFEYKPKKEKVLSEETSYMITSMLMSVTSDTTDKISIKGTDVAGKTGTTNVDEKTVKERNLPLGIIPDSWFVSYSPEYSISLWYGYDNLNSENYMTVTTGWVARRGIMNAIANRVYSTNKKFTKPSGVISVEVEKNTVPLQLPSEFTPKDMRITELFKEGTEPTEVSIRYKKLDTPTNGSSTTSGNEAKITWNTISTPKAIDSNYLQKYFDENYGKFASKYYESRQKENSEQFGGLGYNIYKKVGESLTFITWVATPSYTQTVSEPTTFVVKAAYQKFKANESGGLTISVSPEEKHSEEENIQSEEEINNNENNTPIVHEQPDNGLN